MASLSALPTEIFFQIFSHLSAVTIDDSIRTDFLNRSVKYTPRSQLFIDHRWILSY